jgi:carboxylesterase
MHSPHLMPGAAPFFYPGGEIGCMVLHGFTGAPQEVRWLGQYLNKQGYTVIGPRLAGHGTRPADMQGIRWQEWLSDTVAAFHLLRERCRKVFAVGLSMGATLSLRMAAHEKDIAGVAALAAPYFIYQTWRRPFVKVSGRFGRTFTKIGAPDGDRLAETIRAEQTARGEPITGRAAYPTYPAWALDQLWSLLSETRYALPRVTAPVLLINSSMDDVVPISQADSIFAALGSADKQRITLHNSGHVLTEDIEREVVFKAVGEFIKARSA